MAKGFETPAGVDIAALRNKNTNVAMDLMRPGPGTPWEDRGALGTPKAFIGTVVQSIKAPALLLDHIRRADTTHEARTFAYACSVFWGISAAIHGFLLLTLYKPEGTAAYFNAYIDAYMSASRIKIGILAVVVAAGSYLLGVALARRIYYSLVASELKSAVPRALIDNMFCYCMGPSVLAVIPVVGPPLALLLIFIAWCQAGAKRLYITWRGSIVAAVLSFVAVLVIASAGYFAVNFLLNNILLPVAPTPEEMGIVRPSVGGTK